MLLKSGSVAERLQKQNDVTEDKGDPLLISPLPDLNELKNDGAASIDLRLGRWFMEPRRAQLSLIDTKHQSEDSLLSKTIFVQFGKPYILHPKTFVLGTTLEWIRLPVNLGAYINGKSSWGRRGLIIATAAVIQPGFKGCITLELANVGEIPIAIEPGMRISQLCIHQVEEAHITHDERDLIDKSSFVGKRKPTLGKVKHDARSEALSQLR